MKSLGYFDLFPWFRLRRRRGGRPATATATASPVQPVQSVRPCPCPEPTELPWQPAALTRDLLEEIFLRVASHADLARASAACVSFRRLIADPGFLRRHRSRHPPRLLGFLGAACASFQPAQAPPRPSAPAGRALASAADFNFRYLPSSRAHMWAPCDARDGRVLLESIPIRGNDVTNFVLWDLAVCDPLSREHLVLPRIPEDLLASVQIVERRINRSNASLVPAGDWEDTSFRVLYVMRSRGTRLSVCVFSSTSGRWSVGASTVLGFPMSQSLETLHFAYGCCYWKVEDLNKLIKLDMNTMEFSTVDLPPGHARLSIAIVEAGEGSLGMFSLIYGTGGATVDYYILMENLSGRANEWHMKNTTPLSNKCFYHFIGSAEGYIFIVCSPPYNRASRFEYACFSIEIKTSSIEKASTTGSPPCYPYFGYPPSMSPRRIKGYEVLQG